MVHNIAVSSTASFGASFFACSLLSNLTHRLALNSLLPLLPAVALFLLILCLFVRSFPQTLTPETLLLFIGEVLCVTELTVPPAPRSKLPHPETETPEAF